MDSALKPASGAQTSASRTMVPPGLSLWDRFSSSWRLALLALPALTLIFLFSYIPTFGIIIAFEDYSPKTGFFSPWVGLRNFELLLDSPVVTRLVTNTLFLNVCFITASTFFSVLVALLLNEVRSQVFKTVAQSLMLLPFFMGWTLVSMVLFGLLDYDVGTINALLVKAGFPRLLLTENPYLWPLILTIVRVWKGTGSGCIVYLAALVSIDPQIYEAAAIDGADRIQRMRYINLPALTPLISLMVLLAIGNIFSGDVGMLYALVGQKPLLYSTTDVIDTYILRALRTNANYGISAAVGFLQSVLSFICVYGANQLARWYSRRQGEDYALF